MPLCYPRVTHTHTLTARHGETSECLSQQCGVLLPLLLQLQHLSVPESGASNPGLATAAPGRNLEVSSTVRPSSSLEPALAFDLVGAETGFCKGRHHKVLHVSGDGTHHLAEKSSSEAPTSPAQAALPSPRPPWPSPLLLAASWHPSPL